MTRKDSVVGDDVRAHALQRRRVGVERDRRAGARVADAVDVRGREMEALAGRERSIARRSADREALLVHASADDRHGTRRRVVVVKAGVVIVHPADQPSAQVIVAQ